LNRYWHLQGFPTPTAPKFWQVWPPLPPVQGVPPQFGWTRALHTAGLIDVWALAAVGATMETITGKAKAAAAPIRIIWRREIFGTPAGRVTFASKRLNLLN
jgi:hypothetical protein